MIETSALVLRSERDFVASTGEDGRWHICSSGGQASNLLRAMALANALAVVPDGEGVAGGEEVEVMLLT